MTLTQRTMQSVGLATILAALLAPALLLAYPKPSPNPISWELKFKHAPPQRIAVKVPGSEVPKAFWYMTFSITNASDQEQTFLPDFQLVTKEGAIVQSDKDVPAEAFNAIAARERIKDLLPLNKISGRLLIGNDQTKDGVAIWPEPKDPRLGTFNIFVGGLSGEICYVKDGQEVKITDWTSMNPEEKKKLVILYKTLQLTYQIPGDETNPNKDVVNDKGSQWVMR
jgi:hypothetical protein